MVTPLAVSHDLVTAHNPVPLQAMVLTFAPRDVKKMISVLKQMIVMIVVMMIVVMMIVMMMMIVV